MSDPKSKRKSSSASVNNNNNEVLLENWKKFVISYLRNRGWQKALHAFESETQLYFDNVYCKTLFKEAKWEKLMEYLQPFLDNANPDAKQFSDRISWAIYKEAYTYYVHKNDLQRGIHILGKLYEIATNNQETFKDAKSMFTQSVFYLIKQQTDTGEDKDSWRDDESYRSHVWENHIETFLANCVHGKTVPPALSKQEMTELFEKSLELNKKSLKRVKSESKKDEKKGSFKDEKKGSYKTSVSKRPAEPVEVSEEMPSKRTRKESTNSGSFGEKELDIDDIMEDKLDTVDGSVIMDKLPKNSLLQLNFDKCIVKVAAVKPDDQFILSVGTINPSMIWMVNIKTGTTLYCYELESTKNPKYLTWYHSGDYFAVSFEDDPHFNVFSVSATSFQLSPNWEQFFGDHKSNITALSFDNTSQEYSERVLLATAYHDGCTKIWDTQTAKLVFLCIGPEPVSSVDFFYGSLKRIFFTACESTDNMSMYQLGSVGQDKEIPITVSPKSFRCLDTRPCFLQVYDNRFFLCGINSGTLVELLKQDAKIGRRYEPFINKSKYPCRLSVASDILVIGDGDKIKFWHINNPKLLSEISCDKAIDCCQLSVSGELLCVTFINSSSLAIYFKDYKHDKTQLTFEITPPPVIQVAQSNLILHVEPIPIEVVPAPEPPVIEPKNWLQLPEIHFSKVVRLKYSHSAKALLSLDAGGVNKIWRWNDTVSATQSADAALGEIAVKPTSGHSRPLFVLSSNDSYMILCISGHLDLCQNVQRKRLVTLYKPENNKAPVTSVNFFPTDNNFIIVGLQSGQLMITYVSKSTSWTYDGHSDYVSDIVFIRDTKDDGVLFSASADGKLKQWKLVINDGPKPILEMKKEYIVSDIKRPMYLKVAFIEGSIARLLVFQTTLLQIWDEKEKLHEWHPPVGIEIVDACFSAKGEYVYVIFSNQHVYVFTSTLVRVSAILLDRSLTAIAANPVVVNQIALGTEDGKVWVIEFQL